MGKVTEQICIVVIRDNVVQDCKLFDDVKLAEKEFIDQIEQRRPATLTQEDIDFYLEEGVHEFDNGSVCITHPLPCSTKLVNVTYETYHAAIEAFWIAYAGKVRIETADNESSTVVYFLDAPNRCDWLLLARATYQGKGEPIYEVAQYLIV
jgi:hypothetical protein